MTEVRLEHIRTGQIFGLDDRYRRTEVWRLAGQGIGHWALVFRRSSETAVGVGTHSRGLETFLVFFILTRCLALSRCLMGQRINQGTAKGGSAQLTMTPGKNCCSTFLLASCHLALLSFISILINPMAFSGRRR